MNDRRTEPQNNLETTNAVLLNVKPALYGLIGFAGGIAVNELLNVFLSREGNSATVGITAGFIMGTYKYVKDGQQNP